MSKPISNAEAAVVALGGLPMPVGPTPLELSEQHVEALAAAGNRVVNDASHEDLCMCDAWPEACLSSGNFHMGDWDMRGLESALPAVLALWEQMRGAEMLRLQAQVAELEQELLSANASVTRAAERLRTDMERITELEAQRDRWLSSRAAEVQPGVDARCADYELAQRVRREWADPTPGGAR